MDEARHCEYERATNMYGISIVSTSLDNEVVSDAEISRRTSNPAYGDK